MQHSLRGLPPAVRETPTPAVHASRPEPLSLRTVLRVLAIATGVGIFVTLLGAWRAPLLKILERGAYVMAYSWLGSLTGVASSRFAARLGLWSSNFWRSALATGLIMTPPMLAVVWVIASLEARRPLPASTLPEMLWYVALICIGSSLLAVRLATQRGAAALPAAPPPPKFLERLPLKLRGGEVWAVEAEDHYLRLHTSKGQDLILLRLADAVAELDGIEGAQVHRSWWVARDAIVGARRGDGRATLTLKDGAEVPVSRTYAGELRARGWI